MSTPDTDNVSKVVMIWKKNILLLQKSSTEWELPGGHLTRGETFKKGAKREVFEETGIKINKLRTVLKQKDFCLFNCYPKVIKVKLSDEHINYEWVPVSVLSKKKLTKSTKINIKSIVDSVQ